MDIVEQMAAAIAVATNGGEWTDGKWYSQGHRDAWVKAVQPYADEIKRLQLQLKIFQDDAMGDVKTIDNLSKMAARYRKGLDRIYNLHNSGDEYSEREINDMTYEIVVTAIAGTLYDKGPRLDDRGDNLDGN